jgi:two-component system, OmpR family, response regulator
VAKDRSLNGDPTGSGLAHNGTAKQGRGPARRRSAILIVGDENEVLLGYARSLSAYGYAVDFAHDDAEVARLGREKEFDVVINDIDMRNCCDGQSLRQLRRENKRVPVVVLSGCLAFASARAALDCGAHKYLVKPVSDERLLEVLVDAVQDAAARLH